MRNENSAGTEVDAEVRGTDLSGYIQLNHSPSVHARKENWEEKWNRVAKGKPAPVLSRTSRIRSENPLDLCLIILNEIPLLTLSR